MILCDLEPEEAEASDPVDAALKSLDEAAQSMRLAYKRETDLSRKIRWNRLKSQAENLRRDVMKLGWELGDETDL